MFRHVRPESRRGSTEPDEPREDCADSAVAVTVAATALSAQSSRGSSGSVDPRLLSGLTWRNIGPFRAGRVSAVSGAIGQSGVFYFGAANGGVGKTTSAG